MQPTDALTRLNEPIATRLQLRRLGVAALALTAAVRSGDLLRVRRGYYARPGADPLLIQAVRIGGRLGCIAAARSMGIWAENPLFAHVAMRHGASRLRSPADRSAPLTPQNVDGCELHWWPLPEVRQASVHTVTAVEALAHMRALIDGRCMSGIETLVRLMLLDAGIPFDVQVAFRGIGTVDFLVAGCVVVETDGHLGHDDALSKLRDYRRDAALVRLGYTVVRLSYAQVMFDAAGSLATIIAAVRSHRMGAGL